MYLDFAREEHNRTTNKAIATRDAYPGLAEESLPLEEVNINVERVVGEPTQEDLKWNWHEISYLFGGNDNPIGGIEHSITIVDDTLYYIGIGLMVSMQHCKSPLMVTLGYFRLG